MIYCIIFPFLDYFTGVDLFVSIVCPEGYSRAAQCGKAHVHLRPAEGFTVGLTAIPQRDPFYQALWRTLLELMKLNIFYIFTFCQS